MARLNRVIRHPLLWLLLVAALVHTGALYHTLNRPQGTRTRDSIEYLQAAHHLRMEGTLYAGHPDKERSPGLYTRRPPLYPLLIAAVQFLGSSDGLITGTQAILSLAGAALLWTLLISLGVSVNWTALTVALFLFYPSQIVYSHMIMAEVLLQALLLLSLFFLVQFLQTHRLRFLLLFNIALGLSPLVKPVMLFFWVPNLIFHLWLYYSQRKVLGGITALSWRSKVMLAAAPLILPALLLAWSGRNWMQTGYFHFSSMQAYQLLAVNPNLVIRDTEGKAASRRFIEETREKARAAPDYARASQLIEDAGLRVLLQNWKTYLPLQLRGMVFFFLDPGRYDLDLILGSREAAGFSRAVKNGWDTVIGEALSLPVWMRVLLATLVGINLVVFLAWLCLLGRNAYPPELRVFLFLTVVYVAAVAGPIGTSRMRVAVVPFLLLCLPILLDKVYGGKDEG